jgi:hypothetical protein
VDRHRVAQTLEHLSVPAPRSPLLRLGRPIVDDRECRGDTVDGQLGGVVEERAREPVVGGVVSDLCRRPTLRLVPDGDDRKTVDPRV